MGEDSVGQIESIHSYSPESDFIFTVRNGESIIRQYIGNETEVNIPPTLGGNPVVGIGYTVKSWDDFNSILEKTGYAFADCRSITSIRLPETVTSIGNWAFARCVNLKTINLPEGITTIGQDTFFSCDNLNNIILPSTLTTIGIDAFRYCKMLTEITIPNNVVSIGDGAFLWCERLTKLTLSEKLKTIGNNAFDHCKSLKELVLPKSLKKIGDYPWTFYPNELTLYVFDKSYALDYCKQNHMKYKIMDE